MTGAELKAWRTRHGLTQQQLSRRLSVTTNTIARWERGDLQPSGLLQAAIRGIELEMLQDQAAGRAARQQRRHEAELAKLREAMETIRKAARQHRRNETDHSEGLPRISVALWRRLLQVAHSDKNGGSEESTKLTAWLNNHRPP